LRTLNTSREMPPRVLVLLAAWAALFPHAANAIDPQRAMSQYVRDRWGTEQGFPRGPVYAISQTSDGYLWIGSEAGLLRFDGLNFRLIQPWSGSVEFTSVLGLAADKDGSLWVLLRDRTLIRYRDGRFESPFSGGEPPDTITAMAHSNGGDLLVAKGQSGALTYRNGKLVLLAAASGVPRSPVLALAQTGDGSFWIGTRGAGLFHLVGGKTLPVNTGLPAPKIDCLLPEGAANLWIGTDNGVARWNGTQVTTAGIPKALSGFQVLALARDRDGNIWAGTDSRGLLRFNAQGVSFFNEGNSGAAVTAVFEDREGNLWIGSANGIERLRDSPFVTFSVPEGLPTDGSNPLFVDSEGRVWFPPVNGGLWWMKDGRHGSISQEGLDKDIVYSIAGGRNELWLGRQRGGLTRLRAGPGPFQAQTYTKANGLAQNSVYSVYQDREGAVWAGTLSGGVSKLDQGKFTTYTIADGLASNMVASILEGRDGAMWFATPNGLSAQFKGRWQTFKSGDGLPSENVNCLLEDSTGVLWAGTATGLAFRGPHRFQVPARASSFVREQILGLAEDKYGWLWIAASNRVLRVRRDKLLSGRLEDGDVREYGLADGLRGDQGVKRHRSVITDSRGRIWFSLNHGISVVDPARLTSGSAPGIVHIQTISADGRAIELGGSVRIPSGRQRIVFGYAGLSLSIPERVRFRYKLDEFDRDWSEPAAGREAAYTNLGPGSYRFHVIASNPDGDWSGKEASLAFNVDPAFWQTWQFRTAIVLACALTALALYRLRLRQMTARLNVRFEERLAERTRIAQELHDTLLQGFLSASMQVHVAADRLPAGSQVKPSLTRALELMRQVIDEGRNAVRGLRSTESTTLDLENAFSQIQDELLQADHAAAPVGFRVIVEGKRRPLRPVLRDEVYRIGREALINAFRHARARKIEVELTYSSSNLRIVVRDDGCGIDPQTLDSGRDGHWGLSGMRERADRIGARLKVWSATAGGTEVDLSIPGKIAFVSPKADKRK
jgi:signal transduction histidine kinase/ligand-binding sensor domain-containing protein